MTFLVTVLYVHLPFGHYIWHRSNCIENQFHYTNRGYFPELDGTSCNTVAFMLLNSQHLLSVKRHQFGGFSRRDCKNWLCMTTCHC